MPVALLEQSPLVSPTELGPYRRGDFEGLPAEPRCELLFGRLYRSPSPSALHQWIVLLLARTLGDLGEPSGAVALTAPLNVVLSDHSVVQPDVLYVSAERRGLIGHSIAGAPDLLVEVISPGTARRDRLDKLRLYAESGVREYWIVDPEERQIEFLVNEGGRFVVSVPVGAEYRSSVLAEIRLDMPEFWRKVATWRERHRV